MKTIWPEYPTVELVDGVVVIFYENGSECVWGVENNYESEIVMDDIKNGLRAIKFLTERIEDAIEDTFLKLAELGFSDELRSEYLNEALHGFISKI